MKKITVVLTILFSLLFTVNVNAARKVKEDPGATSSTTTNDGTTTTTQEFPVVWEDVVDLPNTICTENSPLERCTSFHSEVDSKRQNQDQALEELLQTNSLDDYSTQFPVGTFEYLDCARDWYGPCETKIIDLSNNFYAVLFAQHYGMNHPYTINSVELEIIKNIADLIVYEGEYVYMYYDSYYQKWIVRQLI